MSVAEVQQRKPKPPVHLDELRCPSCGRLIARVRLVSGSAIEAHCRHCRKWILRECA